MKKYNYVYVTLNTINGKVYIGDHSTDILDDGYMGSGRLFSKKVKEYGKCNFKKEILEFFPTKKEAFDAQEKYIIQFNSHISQNGYNVSWKGGHNVKDCWSEESKEKCRKTQTGKSTGYMKGLHYSEEEKIRLYKNRKQSSSNSNIKHSHSIESKEKISKALKGRTKLPLSVKTKEILREKNLGHIRQSGEKNSQFGVKWLKNPVTLEILAIKKENVNSYLELGWIFGRK